MQTLTPPPLWSTNIRMLTLWPNRPPPCSYVGDSAVHRGDGREPGGVVVEHARGITCSPFPLFPKSLSQEVCLAHSLSLQGGLGASKQRAEALTQA